MSELSIIQKTYDLIKWYVPILSSLPNKHKFQLGSRTTDTLYNLLEGLIAAKYSRQKQTQLETLNISLDILRYQTRLLFDFDLLSSQRYEYVSKLITEIGCELGGWIKQLKANYLKLLRAVTFSDSASSRPTSAFAAKISALVEKELNYSINLFLKVKSLYYNLIYHYKAGLLISHMVTHGN